MKKKDIFRCVAFCLPFLFLVAPEICSGSEWGDYIADVSIATTQNNEGMPGLAFNAIDGEFITVWREYGEGDPHNCTLNGARISPDGGVVGTVQPAGPYDGGYIFWARIYHNIYRNEYMYTYTLGFSHDDWDVTVGRMDADGSVLTAPYSLHPTGSSTQQTHPQAAFNTQDREYLLLYNDYVPPGVGPYNCGAFLDEDINILSEITPMDPQGVLVFNPQIVYNPIDNYYFANWEDYRAEGDPNTGSRGRSDVYGSLINADGTTIVETALSDGPKGWQGVQMVAHNPDRNEYFSAWIDGRDELEGGGIMGIFTDSGGNNIIPPGEFMVADGPGNQGSPNMVYVPDRELYFVIWVDSRDPDDPEVYGKWVDPTTGGRVGDEINLSNTEGYQSNPEVNYDPVMKRLLVIWADRSADEPLIDYDFPPEIHARPSVGNIMGKVYGLPSFCSTRVIERGTGNPVEDAQVIVIGPGLLEMERANVALQATIELR
jgi:hypothetical protein